MTEATLDKSIAKVQATVAPDAQRPKSPRGARSRLVAAKPAARSWRKSLRLGHAIISVLDSLLDLAVVVLLIAVLAAGSYSLWDSHQVYEGADAKQYAAYKPSGEDAGKSFAELIVLNPDVFAWIEVYGTHIDYPVVQGTDNMQYVNTSAEGSYSLTGAIFLDSYNSLGFQDFSSILYGHHMEKSKMFGEIGNFANREYFDARRYGSLHFDNQDHGLEFFAFLHADAYDSSVFRTSFASEKDKQDYLDMLLARASLSRDIALTVQDRIVLLSTCSSDSTNGRDILVARISDELFANPFPANAPELLLAGDLVGIWDQAPLWTRAMVCILPLALFLMLVLNRRQKRQEQKAADEKL